MANIKLDDDGDLDVSGGLKIVTGDEALIQHLTVRLRFFLGEWFLDTRLGVPYFEEMLVKDPDLVFVRSLLREVVLETPGVDSVSNFELDFDAGTRKASVSFEVKKTADGETLDFSKDFIIGN